VALSDEDNSAGGDPIEGAGHSADIAPARPWWAGADDDGLGAEVSGRFGQHLGRTAWPQRVVGGDAEAAQGGSSGRGTAFQPIRAGGDPAAPDPAGGPVGLGVHQDEAGATGDDALAGLGDDLIHVVVDADDDGRKGIA
jgi:hypothetical protein